MQKREHIYDEKINVCEFKEVPRQRPVEEVIEGDRSRSRSTSEANSISQAVPGFRQLDEVHFIATCALYEEAYKYMAHMLDFAWPGEWAGKVYSDPKLYIVMKIGTRQFLGMPGGILELQYCLDSHIALS